MSTPATPLSDRVRARDPRAIARAISLIEDEAPEGAALVGKLFPSTGHAYLIGITGPPGAGKSTLVDKVAAEWRRRGLTVGVLAVDPTSPFSGGAILGDRVRMQTHAEDPGVFIRSMATRGHLGGLARTTAEAAIVLDAAGFDVIVIETVGVGQDEVDIVRTADVSVVTLVPGTGDEVQALKAGIMEIADIFVVNKADREGADRTAASIEMMLSLDDAMSEGWRPPVLRTEATASRGIGELVDTILRFREQSQDAMGARRRARAEWRLREILGRRFMQHLEAQVLGAGEFERLLDRIAAREVDPYGAANQVMAQAFRQAPAGPAGVVGIDHVGIAVSDPDVLLGFLTGVLGLPADAPEDVATQRSRVRFVDTGDARLELVESLEDGSPIGAFLAKRGPGLHHVALRVRDIHAAIAHLVASGVRMIDTAPRHGAHGALIAFVHPSATHGVLVELKQPAAVGEAH
jgi:LAO/AO transport system kinase